jgi:hypothetical protein
MCVCLVIYCSVFTKRISGHILYTSLDTSSRKVHLCGSDSNEITAFELKAKVQTINYSDVVSAKYALLVHHRPTTTSRNQVLNALIN